MPFDRRSSLALSRNRTFNNTPEPGGKHGNFHLTIPDDYTDINDMNDLYKNKDGIMKKIKPGSEGVVCLVGSIEGLDKPAAAFVRLSEGVYVPALEVPLPTRFD